MQIDLLRSEGQRTYFVQSRKIPYKYQNTNHIPTVQRGSKPTSLMYWADFSFPCRAGAKKQLSFILQYWHRRLLVNW